MAKTKTLYTNNARTTLGSTITSSSVSFTVSDPSSFPSISSAGQFFYVTLYDTVNIEIVKVTSVSGSTFTVTRGQGGTTANAFVAATTVVSHRLTAADLQSFARAGDSMVQLPSITGLALPSTVDPTSYILGDSADDTAVLAIANTGSNIWSFTGYEANVYSGTAGTGATTTSILLANAQTILIDNNPQAYIIQFTSGALQGTARYLGIITSNYFAPTAAFSVAPGASDTYIIHRHIANNISTQLTQLTQMLDPAYVTSSLSYVSGAKRLNAGNVEMYGGSSWLPYVLNYVPASPTTVGGYSVPGATAGYAGLSFTGSYHSQTFLLSATATMSGVYRIADSAWDWRWDNGTLAVGTVPYANVSGTPNMALYAPIASPTFTGTPAAPTAANGTSTTQLATTAFVNNAIVFTGNATQGTKTYVASGIIEQWFESFQSQAGGATVSISFPVAFVNSVARPFVSIYDANMSTLGSSNFVAAQIVSYSKTGCVVNIGQNGGGLRDVTLSISVRGT